MVTMSCHQLLRKKSHQERVPQLQSKPDSADPQGALVVRLSPEQPVLQEALVVCLLMLNCVHRLVGELLKKHWATTPKCREDSERNRGRGAICRCHARRMLPLHRSNHHAVDDPLKMFLFRE